MRQFPIVPAAAVYVHNQLFCFWRSNALIHCHNGDKVFMKSYLHFFFSIFKNFFFYHFKMYIFLLIQNVKLNMSDLIYLQKNSIRMQKFCGPIMHCVAWVNKVHMQQRRDTIYICLQVQGYNYIYYRVAKFSDTINQLNRALI